MGEEDKIENDVIIFVDKHDKKWTKENLKELVDALYHKKSFEDIFEHYF